MPWTVVRSKQTPITEVCDASGIQKGWCPGPSEVEPKKEAKSADPPAKAEKKAEAAPAKEAPAAKKEWDLGSYVEIR